MAEGGLEESKPAGAMARKAGCARIKDWDGMWRTPPPTHTHTHTHTHTLPEPAFNSPVSGCNLSHPSTGLYFTHKPLQLSASSVCY